MSVVANDARSPRDSGALLSGYEDLRSEALRPTAGSRRGIGFVLLVRRGMGAWISACIPLARPAEPAPRKPAAELRVPPDLRAEVATILAEMAFTVIHAQGA